MKEKKRLLLENDRFRVVITDDRRFENVTVEKSGADLSMYDIVFDPTESENLSFDIIISVNVESDDSAYSVGLIGSPQSEIDECAILEENILTVLMCWNVLQLDLTSAKIVKAAELTSMGCNFSIHKVNENYLIYGETDVTMLGPDLSEKWSFSGQDIFISISGKKEFEIKEDRICLYDFEDHYYELDFEGKLMIEKGNDNNVH